MTEQKRFYIGRFHRTVRHPGVVYACLFDRTLPENESLVISADIDYILDAAHDRFPGQVEGVDEDWPKWETHETDQNTNNTDPGLGSRLMGSRE